MGRKTIGTCTHCGTKAELIAVDEAVCVCEECLEAFYFQCEVCGEYWNTAYVEQLWLNDGRTICEHCKEDFDDEDIDFDL